MKISTIAKIILVSLPLACAPALAADKASTAEKMTAKSDSKSAIVSVIKSNIAADKTLSGMKVDVTYADGEVKLSGKVNTDEEASKITEIAESTPGVKDVDTSQLMIKESQHPLEDGLITAKVKGTYVREKLFGKEEVAVSSVKVETTDGVVYLTGTVKDEAQAKNAVSLAEGVKGVKRVDSKIVVENK